VSKLKNVCAISISLPLTKAAVILRLRELARDIDFPAKAATETLPIAFQRSRFSDEIERRLWGNLRCFVRLSGGETIGGYSCEPQFSP
jgi:hypothetical protein